MRLSAKALKLKKAIIDEYQIEDGAGLAILQAAVEAMDLMTKAQTVVNKQGLTVKGDRGQTKAHPLLSVIRDQRSQFFMGLKHLNLDLEPLKYMRK